MKRNYGGRRGDRHIIVGAMNEKQEFREYLRTPKGRQYVAQIEQMVKDARAWLVNNPNAKPIISFEVPQRVMLITDVATALKDGYLRVDKEGQRLLDELGWTADTPSQPSFTMIKMAIELATGA